MVRLGKGLVFVIAQLFLLLAVFVFLCSDGECGTHTGYIPQSESTTREERDTADQSSNIKQNGVLDQSPEVINISKPESDQPAKVHEPSPKLVRPLKVIYNSIPKSGSRTTNMALEVFAERNKFKLIRPSYMKLQVGEEKRNGLKRHVQGVQAPVVFSWQFEYINFTRDGLAEPFYINVVRNPLDREISMFYYTRFDPTYVFPERRKHMDMNMNYSTCAETRHPECSQKRSVMITQFCEVDPKSMCGERTEESISRAKYSLEKGYALVGLTEDLPAFFYLLEKYMPKMFRGAPSWFLKNEARLHSRTATKARPKGITAKASAIMKEHLKLDFDFYYFARKIFYQKLSRYPYQPVIGQRNGM